jgi:hypothetical protein
MHNDNVGNTNGSSNNNKPEETFNSLLSTAAKAIPFLFEDGVGGATTNGNGNAGQAGNAADNNGHDSDKMDLPVDMDMDSPTSPHSSDMSDIFEPPLNTPVTNKKMTKASKRQHKNDSGRANKNKGFLYF